MANFSKYGKGIYAHYPSWSPDGTIITFGANLDTKIPPTRDGEHGLEIYTIASDGSNLQRLTLNESEDSLPHFAPTGKEILFNSSRTGNYHLYTMHLDGREVTPLTWGQHSNWGGRYSNTGKYITFTSTRGNGSNVFIRRRDSQQIRQLTFDGQSGGALLYQLK